MTLYRIAPNVPVFHHVTKWGAPGQVLEKVKLRAGDEIDVVGDEAERLLKAGAIVPADAPVEPVADTETPDAGDAPEAEPASTGGVTRPKHSAPVAEWRRYAVARGEFTEAEAAELSRADLIEALA